MQQRRQRCEVYSQHSWTAQDCYTLHVLHFDMGQLGLKYGCVCLCQQTQSSDYIELHISLQQLNELSISVLMCICALCWWIQNNRSSLSPKCLCWSSKVLVHNCYRASSVTAFSHKEGPTINICWYYCMSCAHWFELHAIQLGV